MLLLHLLGKNFCGSIKINFFLQGVLPANSINPGAVSPFTLEDQLVSLYVVEHLGLQVGQQRNLVCAMGLFTSDNVKLLLLV